MGQKEPNQNIVTQLIRKVEASRKNIVVIGDAIVDLWVHGYIEDCQDGCSKFVEERVVETLGGSANAYQCLKHWAVNTPWFAQTMAERSIKRRYVQDNKIIFRADIERWFGGSSATVSARSIALEMVRCASGVLLSDYDKGFLIPELIKKIAAMCQERGIPCVSDCKRSPDIYAGTILKGNHLWRRKHGVTYPNYVETLGSNGPLVWVGGEMVPFSRIYHPPVVCVNHVGAGDCFSAHLILALSYGFTLLEAALVAHSAGRVYVQHPHNRAPYPCEIEQDYRSVISTSTP